MASDLFTRYVNLRPTKGAKALDSATTLRQWITRNGPMTKFLTDRGPNYTSEVLREVARLFGIDKVFTTAGHKEANGQAERLVKTVTGMMVASWENDTDWDENVGLTVGDGAVFWMATDNGPTEATGNPVRIAASTAV